MSERPEPKYHARTLRLLGIEPKWSAQAVKAIEACEAKCGATLSASVREWYSLAGAAAALAQPDPERADGLVQLPELLKAVQQAFGSAPRKRPPAMRGWVEFHSYEDLGATSVHLPGGDDPPTDWEYGGGRPAAFSEFVRDAAWAARRVGAYAAKVGGAGIGGYAAEAVPPHLDFLAEQFEELDRREQPPFENPFTRMPVEGWHTFRFFDPRCTVELKAGGDPTTCGRPVRWLLTADSEPALFTLYQTLWPCHGYPVQVYAPEGKNLRGLRERFRKRFPDAPRG